MSLAPGFFAAPFPSFSRPASGERYLVCTGFYQLVPCCRFVAALRAKVLALQEMRRGGSSVDRRDYSHFEKAGHKRGVGVCVIGGGGGGCGDGDGREDRGGAGAGGPATIDSWLQISLDLEGEMRRDAGFMSYLR